MGISDLSLGCPCPTLLHRAWAQWGCLGSHPAHPPWNLSPTHEATSASRSLPAMETERLSGSWRNTGWLGLGCGCHPRGPCLPGGVVTTRPLGTSAQPSGAHTGCGLSAGLSLRLRSPFVHVPRLWSSHLSWTPVSEGKMQTLGRAGALLQATLKLCCPRLCGRRAGGQVLTLQSPPFLPPCPPSSGPSLP